MSEPTGPAGAGGGGGPRAATERWSIALSVLALLVTATMPWVIGHLGPRWSAAWTLYAASPLLLGVVAARLALETKNMPLVVLGSIAAFVAPTALTAILAVLGLL